MSEEKDVWDEIDKIVLQFEFEREAQRLLEDFEEWSNYFGE